MNAKTLSILAIITLMVIVAAVLLLQQKTATIPEKVKLFPKLSSTLKEVTEINIRTQDKTITMVRGEEQWLLKERHNYPVVSSEVNKLLFGVTDLTILEAKTSNAALYSKIGVEDISEENAKSSLLTLKKAEGEVIASLIVGNDRVAKIDSTRREVYVRKPDEKRSWLALGQLSIKSKPSDWLVQEVIDIDSDRIRQVKIIHPDGEQFLVFKETPQHKDYQLADLPEDSKVKYPYLLNNIVSTVNGLNLDDVTVASEIEFNDEISHRAVFTTFDGLEVTMITMKKEGKHYAKLTAAFNPDAVWVEPPKATKEEEGGKEEEEEKKEDEPQLEIKQVDDNDTTEKEKPKIDAKKQAKTLNAKFAEWVYEFSEYKVDDLAKKRDDLIEVKKPPVEEKTESTEGQLLPPIELEEDFLTTPTTTTEQSLITPFSAKE